MKTDPSGSKGIPGRRRLASSWRGLIAQWFLITVFPLTVLLMALTFGSLMLHQQAMRDLVGERDLRALHTVASAIEEQVFQRSALLNLLTSNPDTPDSANLEISAQDARFLQRQYDYGLAWIDRNGGIETVLGDEVLWSGLADDLYAHVQAIEAEEQAPQGALEVSPLTLEHPSSRESIVILFASDPARSRVIAGAFSVESLASKILDTNLAGDHETSFLIVDQDGQILYQFGSLFPEEEIPNHPGIAESLRGESGTTYIPSGDSEHVVAFSPVPELKWGLVSEEPWEMVDTPLLRSTQAAPLILAPVLLLALVALWFVARQVVQPLQQLEAQSVQLASGDFEAIEAPVGGILEVQRLQRGLIDMARQLNSAQQSLHDYIQVITTAQEDERRRLARELHDETIQSLIALKQRIHLARLDAGKGVMADQLNDIAAMTEQSIEELRRVTRALRPIYLEDLGLVTALQMLANEVSQTAGIPVDFTRSGDERRLDSVAELSLYRMAQEALSNVARHSKASHASLAIGFLPEHVHLEISDNGVGFAAPASRAEIVPDGHFGVLGLFERAELIGATTQITSSPENGTRLKVILRDPGVSAI